MELLRQDGRSHLRESTIVKSAERALLVLELFAIWRRGASASEVEAALDMPQSSTSVLLRSLVDMGYLDYNRADRTYWPTVRVAMLGDWMRDAVSPQLQTEHVDELRDHTGETVLIGRRLGASVHYLQIARSGHELQFYVHQGTRRPLCISASGRALLSLLDDQQVLKIARRTVHYATSDIERFDEQALISVVRSIRETGISETDERLGGERDLHAIATLIPARQGDEQFSLCVAGPRERVMRRRDEMIAALREWTATYG